MADGQGNGAPERGGGRYEGPRAHDPEPHDDAHDDPDYVTRTRFLTGVAILGGGVLTAAIMVPVVGFAVADTVKDEDFRFVDIGPLSDFPDGEVTSLAVSGPAAEADRRIFLRRDGDELIPIWNRCTHLGCPVAYAPGGDNFTCPCHGGGYDSLGRVTAGPPARPLDRLDVRVVDGQGRDVELASAPDNARVLLGKPYSVDDEFNVYDLKGPGEPVEGVLSNLYPF